MDEVLASSQYIARGEIAAVSQAVVEKLCNYNIPHLIGSGESEDATETRVAVIRLYAPLWSGVERIELEQVDSTQTLVRFCLPGYPDTAETERYEGEIRMALLPPAAAIRLIDVEGDRPRALAYLGRRLHEFRLQRLREIQGELVNALGLLSLDGLPVARNLYPLVRMSRSLSQPERDNKVGRDIPNERGPLREDQQLLVQMWQSGHTAQEIALRTGRSEKTVLNRLTLLRKVHGEDLVPRRK